MKEGWEIVALGDVTETRNGLWEGKKPPYVRAKVLRMTNFSKDCELNCSGAIELNVEQSQLASRVLERGDLIIEKSGGGPNQPVGRTVLFDESGSDVYSFSNFTTRLRITDKSTVLPAFLHKFLKYQYLIGATEKYQTNATNLRNLQLKEFQKIRVPIPPLPEQERIVAKLDAAFAAIDAAKANVERNLHNAKELFQSKLNEVFSGEKERWVEKRLGDAVKAVKTGPFGSLLHKSDYISNGIPLVNPINMVNGRIIPDSNKQVSKETLNRLSGYVLNAGDIVVARRGEIGRCALVLDEQDGWLCGTGSFFIQPAKDLRSDFLLHLLTSPYYTERLEKLSSGATMLNLSNSALNDLEISFPDLKSQEILIAGFKDLDIKTEELAQHYTRKLTELETLKKSLLERAFRGEI